MFQNHYSHYRTSLVFTLTVPASFAFLDIFLLIFKETDGVTLWPSAEEMNPQYLQQLIIRAWNEKPYIAGLLKL